MGGVLQRLVDQAVGSGPVGLRPRRPAMFETGGTGVGIEEQHREVTAAAPEPGEAAREIPSNHALADQRQHSPEPLLPSVPRSERPEDPAGQTVPPDVSMPAAEVRVETPEPSDTAEAVSPPAPLLPEPEQSVVAPPEPRAPVTLQATGNRAAKPVPASVEALPAPLLPPSPQAFDPVPPALAPPPASRHEAAPVAADPAPPEITIHIGRLDIRSDPPKTPRPERAARPASRASTMPTLADYLRGGRS